MGKTTKDSAKKKQWMAIGSAREAKSQMTAPPKK